MDKKTFRRKLKNFNTAKGIGVHKAFGGRTFDKFAKDIKDKAEYERKLNDLIYKTKNRKQIKAGKKRTKDLSNLVSNLQAKKKKRKQLKAQGVTNIFTEMYK